MAINIQIAYKMKKYPAFLYLFISCLSCLLFSCRPESPPSKELSVEQRLTTLLNEKLLDHWFPAIVDEDSGGYFSNLSREWVIEETQTKFIVSQGRHMWTSSKAAAFYPQKPHFAQAAKAGLPFLKDRMWDNEHGGFITAVSRAGASLPNAPYDGNKIAYGIAFGIYGLAALYHLDEDEQALELAKKSFLWLEEHSYDPHKGGYFQHLTPEGGVYLEENGPQWELSLKDQNSSIHLLEAFTELYQVWPDSLLKERTLDLMRIIRDTIVHEDGYMRLFFYPDWKPVSYADSTKEVREANYRLDHVSFGHDIETAFLLLEASSIINEEWDQTLEVAKKMLDHSLLGFDHEHGGLYEMGYYFNGKETLSIIDKRKNWWAQSEALYTLLLFSKLFPEEEQYDQLFLQQLAYIEKHLIDHEYGGWYNYGLDHSPDVKGQRKGHIWKTAYHNGRALMNSLKALEGEYPGSKIVH